tara:strand:+ start:2798 stop:3250 length:453 start_codon:yes stop_codon:yes gene_type:complete
MKFETAVSLHRNLHHAKGNPLRFAWIVSLPTNKAGTFSASSKGKKAAEIHDGAVILKNAWFDVSEAGAARIRDKNREVCAFARGDFEVTSKRLPKNARRVTINMLAKGKADKMTGGIGQGETCFVYADTREPCPKSGLTIYANQEGMFII